MSESMNYSLLPPSPPSVEPSEHLLADPLLTKEEMQDIMEKYSGPQVSIEHRQVHRAVAVLFFIYVPHTLSLDLI